MNKTLQEIQDVIEELVKKRFKHTANQACALKDRIKKCGKFTEKDRVELAQMKLVAGMR